MGPEFYSLNMLLTAPIQGAGFVMAPPAWAVDFARCLADENNA